MMLAGAGLRVALATTHLSLAQVPAAITRRLVRDTPVIVPVVPIADTKCVIAPPVSRQISSAVVRRCTAGLAGFSNCCLSP